MCTATVGATPVYLCTCAASSIFSSTVRGTPGWVNTLNRVPVFPNGHDGVSIRCARNAVFTAVRSGITGHLQAEPGGLVEVEDLGYPAEPLVGALVTDASEERSHLGLPALVHAGLLHPLSCRVEIVGLQVADQEPVVGEEKGVVGPARLAQRGGHLRPDRTVRGPVGAGAKRGGRESRVLLQPARPDPGEEADALHRGNSLGR